jgi:hypothetical protein
MRLFDLVQAKQFCAAGVAVPPPGLEQSVKQFVENLASSVSRFTEGDANFEIYRLNLLHSSERWTLYALANYRRALDMMAPASAPWAHVTLYYSAFFSANAILGMFGGFVGADAKRNRVVDVEVGTPGTQVLRINRKLDAPTGATGSHRAFWDFFYDAGPQLAPWADASVAGALAPVNGDYAWQIATRNYVNYDMFEAWSASTHMHATLQPARFPKTLTGDLGLQFEATEKLVRLAVYFANALGLGTAGGLAGCGVIGSRIQVQRRLASAATPNLVHHSSWSALFAT